MNAFLAEHAPPVLDPFCGGGSIPLEAQRLGLRAYASDLNPVPVLITKALIEIPPKFAGRPPVNPDWQKKSQEEKAATVWHGAQGLAADVRYYGQWMRDEAEKRIGHLYPRVKITKEMAKDRPALKEYIGKELTVIAWLWARTVASPNPAAQGAHIPLVRSFWLSTKKGKEAWARPVVNGAKNTIRFEVQSGPPPSGFDPRKGTVVRTGATCLLTGSPITFDHIRAEGKAGQLSARLLAIVAENGRDRIYLPPLDSHDAAIRLPLPDQYPDTDLPEQALSIRVMLYGMDKHYKLFTPRRLTFMTTLCGLVSCARELVRRDISDNEPPNDELSPSTEGTLSSSYANAIATYLGEAASKTAAFHCTLASWRAKEGKSARAFGRQSLPMVWDFAEVNPFVNAGGSLDELIDSATKTIALLPASAEGIVTQRDATQTLDLSACVVSTDPPYYDNVGYADLSDFYYGWLRRSLSSVDRALFSTLQTPKSNELIATPYRHDGERESARVFFEDGLKRALVRMRGVQNSDCPLTIYYGFKQSESEEGDQDESDETGTIASTGWETILEAIVHGGFSISGTWPMRTESVVGLKLGVNSLASSIILVCRPRPTDASLATRKEFITALRQELPDALRNLQQGNIAPVDLAQAAIGPGMAVFTRYAKVMEADGRPMSVRTALGLINQSLDEVLAEQEGEFDADTRWALAWFEQYGMNEGPFGTAETLSRAKNTAVNGLVAAGIVEAEGGKVRFWKREELPDGWGSSHGQTAHGLGSDAIFDPLARIRRRVRRRRPGSQAGRHRGNRSRSGLSALFDLRTQEMGG